MLPITPQPPPPAVDASPRAFTMVIVAVTAILIVDVIAVVTMAIFAPAQAGVMLPMLLGGSTAAIPALLALIKASEAKEQVKEVHLAINSRMDQMLIFQRDLATANATLAEKGAQAGREATSALATANATGTHTTTTTTTTLDSPPTSDASIVVPPPEAVPYVDDGNPHPWGPGPPPPGVNQ